MTGNARVVPPERADHRVDEIALERHLETDVLVDDLDLDVIADDAPDVGERLLLGAGQRAHIDERLGTVGDHVVLVSRGETGRIGRGAQRRRAGIRLPRPSRAASASGSSVADVR